MWIWLAVAVLAAIGEVLSFDLFLASVAVAAVIVAVLALILPLVLQLSVFAGLSLVGIGFIRPAVKRMLGIEAAHDTGALANSNVAGRRGIVTLAVDGNGGQIRIGEGEFWTARSFDPAVVLAPGETAEVLFVDGLTALVEPVARPAEVETPAGAIEMYAPSEKGN